MKMMMLEWCFQNGAAVAIFIIITCNLIQNKKIFNFLAYETSTTIFYPSPEFLIPIFYENYNKKFFAIYIYLFTSNIQPKWSYANPIILILRDTELYNYSINIKSS